MKPKLEYKKIMEGLAVYKPNHQTKIWWARVRLLNKDFKKSTKTRDLEEAIETAYMIKAGFQNRLKDDKPLTASKTIKAISKGFLAYVDETQADSTKLAIKRYFDRYLIKGWNVETQSSEGKVKNWSNKSVDTITAADILNLYQENKLHGTKIGKYTEIMLKRLFDYLEFNKFLNKEQRPTIPKPKPKVTESFEIFKVDELDYFLKAFEEKSNHYAKNYENETTARNKKNFEKYKIANMYYSLLAKSGSRPGFELTKMKFEDLTLNEKIFGSPFFPVASFDIRIKNGKTSKTSGTRQIPAPWEFGLNLDYFCRDFYNKNYDEMIREHPEKYIFSYSDENKIINNLDEVFNEVREELKEQNKIRRHIKFVPYSFRHTYITFALVQKIDIYLLAIATGTSTFYIENTYSKLIASQRSDEIHKINLFKDLKTNE
jgi:integrase